MAYLSTVSMHMWNVRMISIQHLLKRLSSTNTVATSLVLIALWSVICSPGGSLSVQITSRAIINASIDQFLARDMS